MSKPKSVLAFENRRREDQYLACQRVSFAFFPEGGTSNVATEVFAQDEKNIKNSAEFRRMSGLSMIAPSLSPMFQNRASHSEYVADVAEEIAKGMKLGTASTALTRSIALMHDIGHPPFSHEGEVALKRKLAEVGEKFDHEQAGIEALLGNPTGKFTLSTATLEGAAKRFNRYTDKDEHGVYRAFLDKLERQVKEGHPHNSLHLKQYNHIEGQIAATSDWIAATVTDAQDMMQHYLASDKPAQNTKKFFDDFCAAFPLGKEVADGLKKDLTTRLGSMPTAERHSWAERSRMNTGGRIPLMVEEFGKRLRTALVADVVKNADGLTRKYQKQGMLKHADDVRNLPELIASPSPEMASQLDALKEFYKRDIYPQILMQHANTEALVGQVFEGFVQGKGSNDRPMRMKDGWGDAYDQIQKAAGKGEMDEATRKRETAKLVARYISSTMGDNDVLWACSEYHPSTYQLMMKQAKEAPRPVIAPPISR